MRMESTITGSVNAVLFSIAIIGSQQVYVLFCLYKEANLIPKCTYDRSLSWLGTGTSIKSGGLRKSESFT